MSVYRDSRPARGIPAIPCGEDVKASPTTRGTNSRSAGSRRVRLDAGDRRDQILVAARRLFAERTYAEVSTAELALAAGTTRTNLHYYFRTKRALYLEVLQQFAQVPRPPAPSRHRLSMEQDVDRLFARWLDVLEENPRQILTLIKAGGPGADREVEALLRTGSRGWEDRLIPILDLPDNAVARAQIRSFQGLISGAVIEWLDRGTLSKTQVHGLLTATLLSIARNARK